MLFFVAPIATLILSFLGWAIVPFGHGLCLTDFNLGILYTLALSSLGVYGTNLIKCPYLFLNCFILTSAAAA